MTNCLIKSKKNLSEWQKRKIREDFEALFFAYQLEFFAMSETNLE